MSDSSGLLLVGAWRDLRTRHGHSHDHGHGHSHYFSHLQGASPVHGPELQKIDTEHGEVELSIFESGVPPHFRLTGNFGDSAVLETRRDDGSRQTFTSKNRGDYWESAEEIPEPHQFAVTLTIDHEGHAHTYSVQFT